MKIKLQDKFIFITLERVLQLAEFFVPKTHVLSCREIFQLLDLKHKKQNTQSNGRKTPRYRGTGIFGTEEIGPHFPEGNKPWLIELMLHKHLPFSLINTTNTSDIPISHFYKWGNDTPGEKGEQKITYQWVQYMGNFKSNGKLQLSLLEGEHKLWKTPLRSPWPPLTQAKSKSYHQSQSSTHSPFFLLRFRLRLNRSASYGKGEKNGKILVFQ